MGVTTVEHQACDEVGWPMHAADRRHIVTYTVDDVIVSKVWWWESKDGKCSEHPRTKMELQTLRDALHWRALAEVKQLGHAEALGARVGPSVPDSDGNVSLAFPSQQYPPKKAQSGNAIQRFQEMIASRSEIRMTFQQSGIEPVPVQGYLTSVDLTADPGMPVEMHITLMNAQFLDRVGDLP